MTTQTSVEVTGMEGKEVLTESGGYGSGYWKNFLTIDLEELQNQNFNKTFSVDNVHDTSGSSFREYHGIDITVKLPDGVFAEEVQSLCDEIAERAAELTTGFSVEWNGSNHVSRWSEEGEDAHEFFAEDLQVKILDLGCKEVYDLSFRDNIPFVIENIMEAGMPLTTEVEILAALHECYDDSSSDHEFTEFDDAAAAINERLREEEADAT